MKRLLMVMVLSASVLLVPLTSAKAGNQEWAVAGKILTGLVGLAVLHRAAHAWERPAPAPVCVAPAPVYVAPAPVYVAPAPPTVVYTAPPARTWVEGHYVYRERQVWVPGYWERVWIEPRYETRRVLRGNRWVEERVLVEDGHYAQVWRDGYYRAETEQVWVPGHWR